MSKKSTIIAIILFVFAILFLCGCFLLKNSKASNSSVKNRVDAKIEVKLSDDLTLSFLEQKKVSDFIVSINGKIIDDYVIDSTSIGEKTVSFQFINDQNIKVNYEYKIEIFDRKPPTILLGNSYRVKKGSSESFVDDIFCGDDYDSSPKCTIEGNYNLNVVGSYPVTFKAIDSSGNIAQKDINLIVYEPKGGGTTTKTTKTYFTDIVKKHKTEYTRIGLDISKWQGDVDFDALKKAGVEFVMLRVGTTQGINGKYVLDPKFVQNITNANRVGIDVGIYFYSYANSIKSAKADAEWVLKQLKGYDISLPIAFDWESWSTFNEFHVSFYELSQTADAFLSRLEQAGYQGMLYSSKNYLEKIWLPHRYEVWLAHYTNQTNYQGEYRMWQLCSDGRVDGIKGAVDIDILYLDENH